MIEKPNKDKEYFLNKKSNNWQIRILNALIKLHRIFTVSIILIFILFLSLYFLSSIIKKDNFKKKKNLLQRFKRRFKHKNVLKERISQEFVNSLLLDPDVNINIGVWYSETDLRERADIHRARLSKFGRSKMNGEMLFSEPEGKVYKLTIEGIKKYV